MSKVSKYSFEVILSELNQKIFHPVYFLEGEEPYFIDIVADHIEKNVLDENEREFNQTILYGKETDVLTVISEAKRFPMMADKQVVIIREAQELSGLDKTIKVKQGDGKKETEINLFEEYVKNPTISTILVICYKYKSLDKRKSLAKTIANSAVYFQSEKVKDYKLAEWVEQYIQQKKLAISPKAAALIAEHLGNDLNRIANEIDKLQINLKDRKEITPDDVVQNIGISKEYNVFELQNALTAKNVLKANQIINYFAANPKDNPLPLLMASLYSFFSKVIIVHTLKDRNPQTMASALGVHPFITKEYEQAARNYPAPKLVRIISYLREYDLKSKGVEAGNMDNGELMKELFFKILH